MSDPFEAYSALYISFLNTQHLMLVELMIKNPYALSEQYFYAYNCNENNFHFTGILVLS